MRLIVPSMIADVSFEVYPYQCKQDLLANLPARLKGYSKWIPKDWRVLVIVDRDNEGCRNLKKRLERAAGEASLVTRTQAAGRSYQVVSRLAIEELEAWYFGDWEAVRAAYPQVNAGITRKRGFRDPDAISRRDMGSARAPPAACRLFLNRTAQGRGRAGDCTPHGSESKPIGKFPRVSARTAGNGIK